MKNSSNEPVFLCTLQDNMEADMAALLLEESGISVLKKRIGAGEYQKIYMAMTPLGVDLYVPEEHHAEASKILSEMPAPNQETDIEFDKLAKKARRKRHMLGIVLAAALLGVPVLVFLISRFCADTMDYYIT
jgi:hypothetical protein